MTIDTKRLETDAAYWDEVAPEWADKVGVAYIAGDYWSHEFLSNTKAMIAPCNAEVRFIPRPTKTAAPEWDGEAWPAPIGAKLKNWCGEKRTVVAHDNNNIICRCDEQSDSYVSYTKARASENKLEPLRTAEQRQREELEKAVEKALKRVHCTESDKGAASRVADAILSDGWRKE